MSFNENGELEASLDIINWIILYNNTFTKVKVGRINPKASSGQIFKINEEIIQWPSRFNQVRLDCQLQKPMVVIATI